MIKSYFLDFDGVVLESAKIKTNAFYELYLPYGKSIAIQAKDYHLQHQGVPRRTKFLYIHKNFLDLELSEHDLIIFSNKFSDLCLKSILSCEFVSGVIEFLDQQKKANKPVFLMSATPQAELEYIINYRDIRHYFKEVFGHPVTKVVAGNTLLQKYLFQKENIVFVGDSINDYLAAMELGVKFIGRVFPNKKSPFPVDVNYITSFEELL